MEKNISTDVAILGGGISGLAAAQFLRQKGVDVCVIEKNGRLGGAIQSERRDGFLIEHGPNSTLDTTPLLHELFASVNIADKVEYANSSSSNRYIVRNGRLNALPMSPLAFLKTPLFSLGAKLRLLREPFIAPADANADETLAQFVERRLGKEFLNYAINPFVAGVFAGSPDNLSVRSAFPKLHALEQEYGSLIKGTIKGAKKRRQSAETAKNTAKMLTFRNGLQTLTDAIGASLGDAVHTGVQLENIVREHGKYCLRFRDSNGEMQAVYASALLMTVPAHSYRHLPTDLFAPITGKLGHIIYPPVSMVYFGYRNNPSPRPLDGFGFLVPELEKKQILGTIWSSTIFGNRAPQGGIALTTFVGGSRQPENALLPENELVPLVRKDLKDLMGIDAAPDVVVVKQWQRAIPQYRIGHRYIIEKIEQFERRTPGVFVGGNFRGGISVADCVKQAHAFSEQIAAFVAKQTEEPVIA